MKTRAHVALLVPIMACFLSACDSAALITSGTFKADSMSAEEGAQWAVAPTLFARVNRDNETVVFTIADGTETTFNITALPEDQWGAGCPTMAPAVTQEVVSLSPEPITLAELIFTQPVLEAMCSPDKLQLHEVGAVDGQRWISFDRTK